jgi:hypothetical protein
MTPPPRHDTLEFRVRRCFGAAYSSQGALQVDANSQEIANSLAWKGRNESVATRAAGAGEIVLPSSGGLGSSIAVEPHGHGMSKRGKSCGPQLATTTIWSGLPSG